MRETQCNTGCCAEGFKGKDFGLEGLTESVHTDPSYDSSPHIMQELRSHFFAWVCSFGVKGKVSIAQTLVPIRGKQGSD